jgi:hypothetical protein
MMVKMWTVFRIVTPCSFVGGYQCFRGMYQFHLQSGNEDEGSMFLQKVGNHLQNYTASQLRKS